MQERSEPFLDTDRLTVQLVSNEDIFLFKTIAGRDDDIEDMNMLVQTGLDYLSRCGIFDRDPVISNIVKRLIG